MPRLDLLRHRLAVSLLGLTTALGGCSDQATGRPTNLAALRANADPSTWERLDDATPPLWLRDPRTGITFVRIPPGSFTVSLRGVSRTIVVTRPFLLAQTELTAAQWSRYLATGGVSSSLPLPADAALPMPLSWHDAARFCADLDYRLPTEAEWERACRADHGDDAPWSTPERVHRHAWFNANAGNAPRPVATREANAFGLYDMLGNVWEWCADWYDAVPFGLDPAPVDPVGPDHGDGRSLRGGSWFTPGNPHPGDRTQDYPKTRNIFYGLRPARSLS